jgi:hypothetical protein
LPGGNCTVQRYYADLCPLQLDDNSYILVEVCFRLILGSCISLYAPNGLDQRRIELIRNLDIARVAGVEPIKKVSTTTEAGPLINDPYRRRSGVLGCCPCWDSFVEILNSLASRGNWNDLSDLSSYQRRKASLLLAIPLTIILTAGLLARI